jgi:ribosomal-protein-alanine N-acetyltransferase
VSKDEVPMLHVNLKTFPTLTTTRLVLRRITKQDADELFFLRSDENIMRYICKPKPKDLNDIFALIDKIDGMIASNDGIAWAMCLKDDPRLLGHISFHAFNKEHHRAEVGYMMHPQYYKQGLMDEALKAVLKFGFQTIGLHSIEANVSPENTPSRKLLERNNFIQEAHFKQNYYWEGEFLDSIIYSLLRPVMTSSSL